MSERNAGNDVYPNTYLNLFPPFPRDDRVFVAMSFLPIFEARWERVLAPAIRRVRVNEKALEPHRVDLRKASDSVLTEILEGISRCRFFLADITVVGELEGRPIRNANVLYEVGLAHAARLPEEVALLRSDNAELVFDVMNVRVLEYDPDGNPEAATNFVTDAIVQSLRELDLKKSLTVRRAAGSLDAYSWSLLIEAASVGVVRPAPVRTMRDALGGATRRQAIDRLLEIGALQAEIARLTPEVLAKGADKPFEKLVAYKVTELGQAIVQYGTTELGFQMPEIQRLLEESAAGDAPPDGPA